MEPHRHVRVASPAQQGLRALGLGALAVVFVVVMLTPAVDGLGSLPDHVLGKLADDTPRARIAPPPPALTLAQRATLRRAAVTAAIAEVGVREWPTRPNHSARIVTYRRAVTGIGENPYAAEPWCADFVSWAWRRAGQPIGFGGQGSDYVPELVAWARLSHRWRAARLTYRPMPGDLVVYTQSGQRYGHVGIVVRVKGGRMATVEGNYRDQVSRRFLPTTHASVRGFIRPV